MVVTGGDNREDCNLARGMGCKFNKNSDENENIDF